MNMRKYLLLFIITFSTNPVLTDILDIKTHYPSAIGKHLSYIQETKQRLTINAVQQMFNSGQATQSNVERITFGISSPAVWLNLEVKNENSSKTRRLTIETSWLDEVDVYFVQNEAILSHYQTGDFFNYEQRPIKGRFFSFDHNFQAGTTTIYIRLATLDPMVIPIYFETIEDRSDKEIFDNYKYGFLYGVIIAMLLYNLLLAISLKNSVYFYYSLFLIAFLTMNMSYTEHSFALIWPNSPLIQQWGNPFFMSLYVFAGLIFASRFFKTSKNNPTIHKLIIISLVTITLTEILAFILDSRTASLNFVFPYIFIFGIFMIIIGVAALRKNHVSAKYFIIATSLGAGGATLTAGTVWGIIPHTEITYSAVEYGMILESILLALALANRFNIIEQDKKIAESQAQIDHLTNLNNRRGFNVHTASLWDSTTGNNTDASLIMLDIDHFKAVNDLYGHPFGDEVIKSIANILKTGSHTDDIVARWGGEEFIIYLPNTNLARARKIATRHLLAIQNMRMFSGEDQIAITASFGIATKNTVTDLETLISKADEKLYISKDTGRNKVTT